MSDALLDRARMLAALCGAFPPDAMIGALGLGQGPVAEAARAAVLRALSAEVSEVLDDGYGWRLLPGPRGAALARLLSRDEALRLLDKAPAPAAGDSFARALRATLTEGLPAAPQGSVADTAEGLQDALIQAGALLDAVQFARAVPWLDTAAVDALARATKDFIAEAQRRQDMLVLLPQDHIGYDAEREALSAFLRGKPSPFDASAPPDRLSAPVFVSGIGGVGKSALMARLFRWWQRRKGAPLTIVLDFDRSQLRTGAPDELYREVLRQAATGIQHKGLPEAQARALTDGLKAVRRSLVRAVGTDGASADHRTQLSYLHSTLPRDFDAPWAETLRDLPIAVIFDSFEALDRRGGTNVDTVLGFESLLRSALPGVRAVFSGREEPLGGDAMTAAFGPVPRRMRLTGLAPQDGAALLEQADRMAAAKRPGRAPLLADATIRADIATALQGHPLTLLMAVRFIHTRPEALDELVRDIRSRDDFTAELAQVFLYDRVLDRIDDPEVRGLAHPGLVLRHVDADLIRYVLAGPCLDLTTPPSGAEAARLRDALAGEYWLVETSGGRDPALRHRPDLRTRMLPGLFALPRDSDTPQARARKQALREKAWAVCTAARDFYRDGPPASDAGALARWQALPTPFRMAHALYYAAFLAPDAPEPFDTETARLLEQELGADEIANLPTAWRARVHALLEQDLDEAEMAALTPDLYEKAQSDRYRAEQTAGRKAAPPRPPPQSPPIPAPTPPRAGSAPGRPERPDRPDRPAASHLTDRTSAARLERAISNAFAAGDFGGVLDAGGPYLAALDADDTAQTRLREMAATALWQTPAWQVILCAAAMRNTPDAGTKVQPGDMAHVIAQLAALAANGSRTGLPDIFAETGLDLRGFRTLDGFRFRAAAMTGGKAALWGTMNTLSLFTSDGERDVVGHLDSRIPEIARHIGELRLHPFKQERLVKLSDLNRLYERGVEREFAVTLHVLAEANTLPAVARMFRGLTPELYDPLELLLVSGDAAGNALTLRNIREKARFWPVDLTIPETTSALGGSARLLIQTVDRVGLMRTFLSQVCDHSPDVLPRRLLAMHDLVTRWFFPGLADHL